MGVITAEEFERMLDADFEAHVLNNRAGHFIQVRPPEKQERFVSYASSSGMSTYYGDIRVYQQNRHMEGTFLAIAIGAKFELEDPFESLLRKRAYNVVVDRQEAHLFHVRGGGWGSLFDDDTPRMNIATKPPESKSFPGDARGIEAKFREYYFAAKAYLRTIDSEDFRTLLESLKDTADKTLSALVESYSKSRVQGLVHT